MSFRISKTLSQFKKKKKDWSSYAHKHTEMHSWKPDTVVCTFKPSTWEQMDSVEFTASLDFIVKFQDKKYTNKKKKLSMGIWIYNTHTHIRYLYYFTHTYYIFTHITWNYKPSPGPPPPPPLGVMSSLRSLARRALSRPRWWAVALFFWVRAIYQGRITAINSAAFQGKSPECSQKLRICFGFLMSV